MKKILIILIGLFTLFGLTGCDIQISDPNITIDQIENENIDIIQIQNQITKTVKKVEDRCVGILAISERSRTTGSGVIYKILDTKTNEPATATTAKADIYVVTNEHVIKPKEKNTRYKVYIGTERYYTADCLGSDAKNDLAVLKFSLILGDDTIQYDDFADFDSDSMDFPAKGSYAIAIGCPLSLDNFNYATFGLIGGVSLVSIMHSAPINPGNSGGGLFNTSGRLIGINVSKKTTIDEESGEIIPIDGIGRAIPIWTVKRVVEDIEGIKANIERPELGITVREVNSSINDVDASYLPATINEGLLITSVEEESNASLLNGLDKEENKFEGLKRNDIITLVNDKHITHISQLEFEMGKLLKGSEIKIKVYRKLGNDWLEIEFKGKLKEK